MGIVKIIVFIVLVNFMSFELVLTQDDDVGVRFSSKKLTELLLGKWYYVAVIKQNFDHSLRCIKQDVIKGKDGILVFKWSGKDPTGRTMPTELNGIINNSELALSWSDNDPTLHSVTVYDTGNQILLCQKPRSHICSVLSRKPSISKKSRRMYEKLAKRRKMRISYINQDDCD